MRVRLQLLALGLDDLPYDLSLSIIQLIHSFCAPRAYKHRLAFIYTIVEEIEKEREDRESITLTFNNVVDSY